MALGGGSVDSQELDFIILLGPFQLSLFCYSVTYVNLCLSMIKIDMEVFFWLGVLTSKSIDMNWIIYEKNI